MITSVLLVIAIGIGCCIGAVGIGGVLLIPQLTLLAGVSVHQASATALFTFLFTGIYGTWLFHRRGSINWRVTLPVCIGAVLCSYLGALANTLIGDRILTVVIALIITFVGVYTWLPARRRSASDDVTPSSLASLVGVGALAGFGAGLSGAGGPLFAVPMMLFLGFAPLSAVGAGQVLQIAAAFSGSLANLRHGLIDFPLAGWLIGCELIGVCIGAYVAHRVPTKYIRMMVASLCVVVGVWIFSRAV